MNYSEFKTFLAGFLWKESDTALLANLDNLVIMGEAELSRKLKSANRTVTMVIDTVSNIYELPSNFRNVLSLTKIGVDQQYTYVTPEARQALNFPSVGELPYYTITRNQGINTLRTFDKASVSVPVQFNLTYRTGVPSFKNTDASWLEQEYLDVYTYTVLSHTAPFLREDERVPLWQGMKTDAIQSANDDFERNIQFGASPLGTYQARTPPQTRRR